MTVMTTQGTNRDFESKSRQACQQQAESGAAVTVTRENRAGNRERQQRHHRERQNEDHHNILPSKTEMGRAVRLPNPIYLFSSRYGD